MGSLLKATGWRHLPLALILAVALTVCPISVGAQQDPFAEAMRQMEQAKAAKDWKRAEICVRTALNYQFTEYAARSLVWLVGLQDRFDESLPLAQELLKEAGPTVDSLGAYAEQAFWAGDFDLTDAILTEAEKRGFQHGANWRNKGLVQLRQSLNEARSPAVYELSWTIPYKDFKNGKGKFLFPGMDHPTQKFTFTLEGAQKYEVTRKPDLTMVEIWSESDTDVVVHGSATIYPQSLGYKNSSELAQIPLQKASAEKTSALYYHAERIDPDYQPCKLLAQQLTRKSAIETMGAILKWRDDNITYEQPPKGNTLETVLTYRKGVCHHSAYLSVCLARAAGIPAYVIGGVLLPSKKEPFTNFDGSHGWGEVELPKVGRIAYESQKHKSLLTFVDRKYYLRFFTQDATRPYSEIPELRNCISLQGYTVSGQRLE